MTKGHKKGPRGTRATAWAEWLSLAISEQFTGHDQWTAATLGQESGVGGANVQRYVREGLQPKAIYVRPLAEAFGVTTDHMLLAIEGKDPPIPKNRPKGQRGTGGGEAGVERARWHGGTGPPEKHAPEYVPNPQQ